MNERIREIISILLKNPTIKSSELADKLSLTKRQVNYAITQFNQEMALNKLSGIVRKNDGTFFVPLEVVQTITENLISNELYSDQERVVIILYILTLNNEYTRGNTSKILDSIGLLQENGFKPGAVLVVNKTNVSNLIDEYNFFNSIDVGLKLNPMFIDGEAKMHKDDLGLNPDEYIENFVKFFKYWTLDNNGKINVATCNELVNLILNEHSGVCTFNSCLGKWLCFDSDANIYPCDRLCTPEYSLGSVDTLSKINQIFESDVFYDLLKESVERRTKCIKKCEYYKNCYAGCNANAILNKNDGYENGISCYIHKGILERIKSYVLESVDNTQKLNPQYVKTLERAKNRRR